MALNCGLCYNGDAIHKAKNHTASQYKNKLFFGQNFHHSQIFSSILFKNNNLNLNVLNDWKNIFPSSINFFSNKVL